MSGLKDFFHTLSRKQGKFRGGGGRDGAGGQNTRQLIQAEDIPTIDIRHPGYRDTIPPLMKLSCCDVITPGTPPQMGTPIGLVISICRIITGNRNDIFITERLRDGPLLSPAHWETLIATSPLYLHVPGFATDVTDHLNDKYPVCPTFQQWIFPPSLPSEWLDLENVTEASGSQRPCAPSLMSQAVKGRDLICRITQHHDALENAHLVPAAEWKWFNRNQMADFAGGINSFKNGIALRQDIHTLMDTKKFTLFPVNGKLVAYSLKHSYEFLRDYHREPIGVTDFVKPHYLYSRFAWSIFPINHEFLAYEVHRRFLCVDAVVSEDGVIQSYEQRVISTEQDLLRTELEPSTLKGRSKKYSRASNSEQLEVIDECHTDPPDPTITDLMEAVRLDLRLAYDDDPLPISRPGNVNSSIRRGLREIELPAMQNTADETLREETMETKRFSTRFPELQHEVEWSDSSSWQETTLYPGVGKMNRLKKDAIAKDKKKHEEKHARTGTSTPPGNPEDTYTTPE